jgi:succinate dehydrogenase/fumarate reductase cytochrome b subunit
MPRIFKPLASIVVWILFVLGCIGVVHFFVAAAMGEPGEPMYACMAITVVCFILSVCAMKLRQMLE